MDHLSEKGAVQIKYPEFVIRAPQRWANKAISHTLDILYDSKKLNNQ